MAEYKICSDYAILMNSDAEPVEDVLVIRADLPDKSTVKLYCCESGEIKQKQLFDSECVFDRTFLEEGNTYVPEFIKQGSTERINACAFKVIKGGNKLYITRKPMDITREISKMWKVIADSFSVCENAERFASKAYLQVTELAKGYRTE